MNIVILTLLM